MDGGQVIQVHIRKAIHMAAKKFALKFTIVSEPADNIARKGAVNDVPREGQSTE